MSNKTCQPFQIYGGNRHAPDTFKSKQFRIISRKTIFGTPKQNGRHFSGQKKKLLLLQQYRDSESSVSHTSYESESISFWRRPVYSSEKIYANIYYRVKPFSSSHANKRILSENFENYDESLEKEDRIKCAIK
ncbi:hypothetical protein TNCT_185701 [Trichonephila clavata]|uniref:Uncharacterized protein n=1 Tax=Trichonephila clavata TaxID=2740835 RepID=A0A8X6JL52_TRICU|nr:hypothetical protein TNCT_185701 [Trichonephila clavata]